jgi:glucose/arabinose dehydrogenase
MKVKLLILGLIATTVGAVLFAQAPVTLIPVVSGLQAPVFVTNAGDGTDRLFVIEQPGRIRIIRSGELLTTPFLDISANVEFGGEKGLLGLAFHPDFKTNRRFFVDYTTRESGQLKTVVAEYLASNLDPDRAEPFGQVILTFNQPFDNHNGGCLAFGPDGYLYVSAGDGGSGGDPLHNGQNLGVFLGKILRIDVDSGAPYAIPADNPYVTSTTARPEIWAYGLRNPWRFSFDRMTGRLFVGDVGQGAWEEVDIIERGGDYGWSIMEGNHCYPPGTGPCDSSGLIPPIAEYSHSEGVNGSASITGGYVYRGGSTDNAYWGAYIFADYIAGKIWALTQTAPRVWNRVQLLDPGFNISSFGEDEHGEMYVVRYSGVIYRLGFASRAVLAQAADGEVGGDLLRTSVLLVNNSNQPAHAHLTLYGDDGQPRAVSIEGLGNTPLDVTIPAQSARSFRTTGESNPVATGWVDVVSDVHLAAAALYALSSVTGVETIESSVDRSSLARIMIAPVSRSAISGVDTALALVNPSNDHDIQVTVTILDPAGITVGEQALTLTKLEHQARFAEEIVTSLPAEFDGTLIVTASDDIAVAVLRTKDGLPLSSVPIGN